MVFILSLSIVSQIVKTFTVLQSGLASWRYEMSFFFLCVMVEGGGGGKRKRGGGGGGGEEE